MKKSLTFPSLRILTRAVSALCLAGTLAACNAPAAEPRSPLAGHVASYEASVQFSGKNLDATGSVSQQLPGECSVRFTAPASLDGMVFAFRDGGVEVVYKELSFPFSGDGFPGGAAAEILVEAIDAAIAGDGVTYSEADGPELSGSIDAGPFTLSLDPETGSPKKISVPTAELEIELRDFRFSD